MRTVTEPSREINVVDEVDVIVAGGGPGGLGAAISAARNGARVLLLEKAGCVGGVATSGYMSDWSGNAGLPLFREITRREAALDWHCNEERRGINHEKQKLVLLEMLQEAGVRLQLHTLCAGVIMEGQTVRGVITESKSGREAIIAKVVVDATGDGDIAFRAGAAFQKGREGDGLMQPVTLMFKLGGVDYARAVFPGSFESLVDVPKGELQALGRAHLPHPAGHVLLYRSPVEGQVVVNMTNLTGVDGTDVRDITRAELECRRQIPHIVEFLREFAPGYEACYHVATAECVGVRETRHFTGIETIAEQDILEARVFPDWIATDCYFNFDIHNLSGPGLDANGRQHEFKARGSYTIPYGACVPESVDGLLLSGRNISGTHKAHSNFRVMGICLSIGYGVGIAAALAARGGLAPRQVAVSAVQERLAAEGISPRS